MWTQCYLTLDSNTLKVKKKINKDAFHEFEVLDLRVSKTYKKYKRKIVMGLVHKKKDNYLIGFDKEINCARVYELIRNLIREKYKMANSKVTKNEGKAIKVEKINEKEKIVKKEEDEAVEEENISFIKDS